MKKGKCDIIAICVICILLVISAGYMILTRGSVQVKSQSDHAADETVYFLQKNPQWGDEKLGSSSYTMGSSGCLTTCIASGLQMQHIAVPKYRERQIVITEKQSLRES